MAINETLPISNDMEMLAGGQVYDATLHEMLMHSKKTLAVKRYEEMAARLTTKGGFPIWLLADVPVAFAGTCLYKEGFLKTFDLQGSVVIDPIAIFKPAHENQQNIVRLFFKNHIPKLMNAVKT